MPTHGSWSTPIPADTAYRRAGGRRHRNRLRQLEAERRHVAITLRCLTLGWPMHGVQKSVAKEFDVSEATVSRAVRKTLEAVTTGTL